MTHLWTDGEFKQLRGVNVIVVIGYIGCLIVILRFLCDDKNKKKTKHNNK